MVPSEVDAVTTGSSRFSPGFDDPAGPGSAVLPPLLTGLMLAFIAAKLVTLAVLGVNTAFIMDEYWIADQALRSPALLYQDIFP